MLNHEKFIAFMLLGMALMALAFMLYLRPLPDSTANSGVLQILNMIIGALISAFGAAVQALFRIKDTVTVDNSPAEPVPMSEPNNGAPIQPSP
jgi:hypothetical protein